MLVFTLALALTLGGAALVAPKAEAATLVYADEFNGPLDASTWQVKTPFNTNYVTGELQYYTAQNLSFQNGSARILTERRSINGYNYASAMITSLNRPKFTYGYFESRFNMPTGKGIWPAFWLTNDRTQEIDMMELIGEDPYRLYMTYHKGGTQVFQRSFSNGTDLTTGWHTIGMDWQPTYIKWYVDGALAATYTGSIPSDPMYLIFNTAVGGAWPADPDA
jgi:beta-glucanase (GH16 family)